MHQKWIKNSIDFRWQFGFQNGAQFPTKNQCKNRSKNNLLPNPTHKVEMPAKPMKKHIFRIGSGWPSGSIRHSFCGPIINPKINRFFTIFFNRILLQNGLPNLAPRLKSPLIFESIFGCNFGAKMVPQRRPKISRKSPGKLPEISPKSLRIAPAPALHPQGPRVAQRAPPDGLRSPPGMPQRASGEPPGRLKIR